MSKVKILTAVIIVEGVFCVFFFLFSVVQGQQAEKNFMLAMKNEEAAKKNQLEAEKALETLKACQEKNK
jgi:hypothetical protein